MVENSVQSIVDKITALRNRIEKQKQVLAELKGQHSQLLKVLEKEFGVKSLEEAQQLLDEMSSKIEKQTKEIEERWQSLVQSLPDCLKEI